MYLLPWTERKLHERLQNVSATSSWNIGGPFTLLCVISA